MGTKNVLFIIHWSHHATHMLFVQSIQFIWLLALILHLIPWYVIRKISSLSYSLFAAFVSQYMLSRLLDNFHGCRICEHRNRTQTRCFHKEGMEKHSIRNNQPQKNNRTLYIYKTAYILYVYNTSFVTAMSLLWKTNNQTIKAIEWNLNLNLSKWWKKRERKKHEEEEKINNRRERR